MAAFMRNCLRCSRNDFSVKYRRNFLTFFHSSLPANNASAGEHNADSTSFPEIIFSGIQPTGEIHLGNYFGAIKRWVDYQNQGKKTIYSIVDLHSLTVFQDPTVLRNNIYESAASILACGINPEKSIFFLQSQVPEHSQLAWILSCMMSLGRISNLAQYKEKSAKMKEVPLGLLSYPVLQSADILLYKATHVPVGEDQTQHLQIVHHLSRAFNKKYGVLFPCSIPLVAEGPSARLRSLRSPEKKMSKSEENCLSRINLLDPPDTIVEKFKKAVTDCNSAITYDPQVRPGVSNLVTIHSLVTGKDVDDICNESKNFDTGQYKLIVADEVIKYMEPIRKKAMEYLKTPDYIREVLVDGAERASAIAKKTWEEVKCAIGISTVPILREEVVKNSKQLRS